MEREIEQPQAPAPDQRIFPVCPYCGADPASISSIDVNFSATARGVVFYCGVPTCRKIHAMHITQVNQPLVATPNAMLPNGKVVIPGR